MNPSIFIVLCYIYAGIDPGININYKPAYEVNFFDTKDQAKDFLMKNETCHLYRAQELNFIVRKETILKKEEKISEIEIIEKLKSGK